MLIYDIQNMYEEKSEVMQGLNINKTEDILIEAGLLSTERLRELKELEQKTGENLEKILLSEGAINYKEILSLRANKMGLDFVDLENVSVNKSAIPVIKPQIAVQYCVFPFDIRNNLLYLAMQNPDDIFLIDEIKVFTQMEIKPFLADSRVLNKAIKYFYNDGSVTIRDTEEFRAMHDEKKNNEKEISDKSGSNEGQQEMLVSNADELIGNIILNALKLECTDIHIDLVEKNLRIRYRIDGVLIEENIKHCISFEEFTNRLKTFAGLKVEHNVPQKGCINFEMDDGVKVNMEVLVLPVAGGRKVLIKLRNNKRSFTISDIGISEKEQKQIKEMLEKRSGLIIITGLNDSGRTATGYALIKSLMCRQLNIMSIEKRIAEKIEGICQISLDVSTANEIAERIDCLLEHDADVILADINLCCSNDESIKTVRKLMDTALSGKLVLVTMNFPNVYETISGLLNMGLENYIVASAISGIIAQYLVRKKCSDTGFKGKAGIFEIFTMSNEFKNLIIKGNNSELLQNRIQNDYNSFKNNCIRLINDNITTVEEIIRIGIDKEMLIF